MPTPDELQEVFKWRPLPPFQPDPAALWRFVVDLEQPAVKQVAVGAYLDYAAATAQAHLDLIQTIRKAVGQSKR